MSPQEKNRIRNFLLRRIDYPTLESIIDQNYRYAKNEFEPDYTFHDFNYGIATLIVEDLQIMNYIDLNIDTNNSGLYDDLIDYFYDTLKNRTRKLYDKLTNNKNLQEQIRKVLREIEENRVQIRLGRSAERHFGKVQNIIIIVDDQDITSEDDVPGLGKMNIVIKDNEIIVGDIFIPEKYRKQGIATIVYQKISDYFNLPIVNSKTKGFNQTIEGGYIWKKRERFEPKNLQEQISRMKSMMGIIKEQNDLICQHCNSRTKSNIDTLSGDTKIKAIKFIDNVFNKLGKTLTITNGYRSTEEQNKLYCQGRPKDQFCVDNNLPTDGKRVTTKKGGCSKHNYKEAFDVYFTKADGNPDLGTQMTEDVAKIGEELGLEWGGRWTDFTDKPHFQSPGRLCQ